MDKKDSTKLFIKMLIRTIVKNLEAEDYSNEVLVRTKEMLAEMHAMTEKTELEDQECMMQVLMALARYDKVPLED